MSEDKNTDNDPERTLVTLEQLSQTIEVMTSVVNRLRQHLSDQLQAKLAEQKKVLEAAAQDVEESKTRELAKVNAQSRNARSSDDNVEKSGAPTERASTPEAVQELLKSRKQEQENETTQRESFVVEIRQQDPEPVRKNDKTLH